MERRARDTLAEEGFSEEAWEFEYFLDTRYEGQVYEVEIQVDRDELDKPETIENLHHAKHEELYTFSDRQSPIRVINARVSAIATTDDVSVPVLEDPVDPDEVLKTHRKALFSDSNGYVETPIYDGERAMVGRIAGPAIVEQHHTTVVVPPSSTLLIDNHGNYIIDPTNS
jgi:N-methylhydantoinase A